MPSPTDLHQIVAYALAKGCGTAVLIYPGELPHPFRGRFGTSTVLVQTLSFELEGDLDASGNRFLQDFTSASHPASIAPAPHEE
jgi:5-methylcytosine-specific restriction enzyme subunit McrC